MSDYVVDELRRLLATTPDPPPPKLISAVRARGPALRARRRAVVRRRAGIALAIAALLVAASFTPPGRAVAERVGELVGIGEPSSVLEANLRDPRLTHTQELLGPVLVAASGTVPDTGGERFEIDAWAARQKLPPGGVPLRAWRAVARGRVRALSKAPRRSRPRFGQPLSCLGIVYPDIGTQETGKWCAGRSTDQVTDPVWVYSGGAGISYFGPDEPYEILGVAEPDVDRVEATYVDHAGRVSAPVTLGRLDGDLLEKTGAQIPFGFFVAFIPSDGGPRPGTCRRPSPVLETVFVTAYDAQGRELGHDDAGARYRKANASCRKALR